MNLNLSDIRGVRRERDFVAVSGKDSTRFLQGMWTCDISLLSKNAPAVAGGLLLTLKAKPVSEARILSGYLINDAGELVRAEDGSSANTYVISLPAGRGASTVEAMDRYLVADDVELRLVTAAESSMDVYTCLVDNLPDAASFRVEPLVAKDVAKVFRAENLDDACAEGAVLLPVSRISPKEFELWIMKSSPGEIQALLSADDHTRLRVERGVPEWGVDITDDSFVLEFPFEDEISFHKGCYLGQEVVARGSYRGQVAKAFVRFHSDTTLALGYIFAEGADEKPCGKITSAAGSMALGQLRLRDLENRKYYLRVGELDSLSDEKVPIKSVDVLSLKVPD
ncbi:hypothetical protein GW916_12695 [bacterium]|nr:hypothetical protein [bacterium]